MLRAETDGSVTRLRDVARIELGAQDYTLNAYLDNKNADGARHLPAAGLQRARHRRRHQGGDGAS